MIQKQVFIIADIGLGQHQSFHVGDEAMFACNLQYYKELKYKITASSRSLTHRSLDFVELPDIYITGPLNFLKLVSYAWILKIFGVNLFPKFFQPTIAALLKSSLLHISGGGNIRSLWPGHIYYRSLMMWAANFYGIETKLTSQTIGPITKRFHSFILKIVLNKVAFIGIRDQGASLRQLKKLKITRPIIQYMKDDSFSLEPINTQRIKMGHFKIGLSLHAWNNINSIKFKKYLFAIHQKFPEAHLYLIPHLFDENNGLDTKFMSDITRDIPKDKIHHISSSVFLMETDKTKIPGIVKGITSKMDILLSTRYHGLVFALSSGVPVIAINYDQYYRTKNNGAFAMVKMRQNSLEYLSFSVEDGVSLIKRICNRA